MSPMDLPGLERLLEMCQRLELELITTPPAPTHPMAGACVGGYPLDPILAAFYARFGKAIFAPDVGGIGLLQLDDTVDELETQNQQWRSDWQAQLPVPLFVFGGEPGSAYSLVTVPGLADAGGRQPVLLVDLHEEPHALPIASNVDRLFHSYSCFLEALVTHPDYADYPASALVFPWDVTDVLARDERLVELMRAGHFDSLMHLRDPSVREWVARVTASRGQ
jgi:hypothetical protein